MKNELIPARFPSFWGTVALIIVTAITLLLTLALVTRWLIGLAPLTSYGTLFVVDKVVLVWLVILAIIGGYAAYVIASPSEKWSERQYRKELREAREELYILLFVGNPLLGPIALLAAGLVCLGLFTTKVPGFIGGVVSFVLWLLSSVLQGLLGTPWVMVSAWVVVTAAILYLFSMNFAEGASVVAVSTAFFVLSYQLITKGMLRKEVLASAST